MTNVSFLSRVYHTISTLHATPTVMRAQSTSGTIEAIFCNERDREIPITERRERIGRKERRDEETKGLGLHEDVTKERILDTSDVVTPLA